MLSPLLHCLLETAVLIAKIGLIWAYAGLEESNLNKVVVRSRCSYFLLPSRKALLGALALTRKMLATWRTGSRFSPQLALSNPPGRGELYTTP